MNMKNLITTTYLVLFSVLGYAVPAFSQGVVKGTLKDQKGEPVPYANIIVYQSSDSSLLKGTVSEMNGTFQVSVPQNVELYLKLSAVGYKKVITETFILTQAKQTYDFGEISVPEDLGLMSEVKVTALRPQVVMEADKMVVSVEGTALAAGSTVYEVLEKAPGVFVDQEGNIQLNGKAGVQIMIDGRLSYLSAEDLQTMLQGMSAENLKNIEIINNPSAIYDAQGNSGIINITLKKNTLKGINGSLHGGANYNGLPGYQAGMNLNHKKGKLNSFVNADFSRRNRIRDADLYRVVIDNEGVPSYFDQEAKQAQVRLVPSLRMGTDYDLNDKHSVGVMLNFYAQREDDSFKFNSLLSKNNLDTTIISNNQMNREFLNSRANVHHIFKLDTNGTKLTTDLNYIRLTNQGNSTFSNDYFVGDNLTFVKSDLLKTNNPSYYDILSGQIDFERKLGQRHKLETGIKASSVTSDNDLQFYIVEGDNRQYDSERSNHFVYKEQILMAYTSFSGRLSDNLSYNAGLRAEQTYSEGNSITLNTTTKRDYFNLFPSLFLQHKVSDNYQVNYNYSRRIDRPDYDNLNPFIFYLDPKTWAQGNPYLRPQFSHSVGITQTFMQQYNLVLNASITDDVITELPIQNAEDGTTVFQQTNLARRYNYTATAVVPFQPFKWWGINNNATVFYQDFSFDYQGVDISRKQTTVMLRLANTFSVGKGVRLELNANYQSGLVWGLFEIAPQWGMDFGVKKSFFKDKLSATVNVSDIFRTRQWSGNTNYGGNINEISQYFGQQAIGFSLRYNFSKGEQFKAKNYNSNLEELNRAGGN